MVIIRPFDESTLEDYNILAALRHANRPDFNVSGERLKEAASKRLPSLIFEGWIAETEAGIPVGVALFTQHEDLYHPHKFASNLTVHPDYRRQGIGSLLWETLESALMAHDPIDIKTSFFEDSEGSMAFAEKHGASELARRFKSTLDLAAFDPSAWGDFEAPLREQGIVIKSWAELADDPQRDQKLYDLSWEVDSDVPFYEEIVRMPFDRWQQEYITNSEVLLDSSFVAVDVDTEDEPYAGFTHMMEGTAPQSWLVALTGTARSYRRRGISRALKLRAAVDAKARGAAMLETYNDVVNTGILAINQAMGFVRYPAIIAVVKRYREE